MPHSLRVRLNNLRYKKIISDKDYERLCKALDNENVLDKIRAEILNDWQIKKFPSSPFSCGLRYAVEIIDKYRKGE